MISPAIHIPDTRRELLVSELLRYAVMADPGRVFAGWDSDTIRAYLSNRLAARRLVRHVNGKDEADGLVTWHRFASPFSLSDVRRWRPDDEDGGNILILAAILDTPAARRSCMMGVLAVEPDAFHLPLWAARRKSPTRPATLRELPRRAISKLLKI